MTDGQPQTGLRRFLAAVALVAVAAFAGLLYAVYRAEQPPEGPVPVVRAPEGPIKVRPTDPGGMKVRHQDKLVFDGLADDRRSMDTQLRLPPAEPPVTARTGETAASQTPAEADETQARAAATPEDAATQGQPSDDELAPQNPDAPGADASQHDAMADAEPARLPRRKPAVPGQSDAPDADPADRLDAEVAQLLSSRRAADKADGGAWHVQLAALSKRSDAAAYWERVAQRHPDLTDGLAPRIAQADGGGLYRLRAGPFDSEADARRFCDAMAGDGRGCLVVRP